MPEVAATKHEASSLKESPKKVVKLTNNAPSSQLNELSKTLLVKRNKPQAQLPKRGSEHAAGYDLASCVDIVIPAKGKALIDTGISLSIPAGHYGRVAPRSGLASKSFIDVGAGVIDCDYRGPLMVLLFNFSEQEFSVKCGDRIAQLILEKISTPEIEEVSELEATARGSGGFGSTIGC